MAQQPRRNPTNNNIRWGLDNPHPFSQMRTEPIREGKYDEYPALFKHSNSGPAYVPAYVCIPRSKV